MLGPGGSGVSAVATAGAGERPRARRERGPAVSAAQRHTLLITLDRLSPVSTWAGVYRQSGVAVAVSKHLHLLTLDRLEIAEQTWATFVQVLDDTVNRSRTALPGVGILAGIDAAELTELPGIDDFLLLRRIRDEAISGDWHRIVVDCSGCGDPFTFLRAGAVLSQALHRLWPRHRRLAVAAERPAMAALTAAVDAIDRDCADINELLTDADAVAAHVVLAADERGDRQLEPMVAAADLMGLPLASVVLNHGVGRCEADVSVDRVTATAGPVRVGVVNRAPEVIDRMARLRKLGVSLPGPTGRPRGSAAASVTPVPDAGDGPVYELAWPQQLPEPDALALGRSGDDLLVTVCGLRHPVRLPSVLRRCTVLDAAWDGEFLRIRFIPDPSVWPRR